MMNKTKESILTFIAYALGSIVSFLIAYLIYLEAVAGIFVLFVVVLAVISAIYKGTSIQPRSYEC